MSQDDSNFKFPLISNFDYFRACQSDADEKSLQDQNKQAQSLKKLSEAMALLTNDKNEQFNKQIDKLLQNQRQKILQSARDQKINKKSHECQKCDCSGTTQCNKKITFLQNKINQFLNIPQKKEISRIYDIQKQGLDNQSYLVQYMDNSLEKLTVKFLKTHYLADYIQFLENSCFDD